MWGRSALLLLIGFGAVAGYLLVPVVLERALHRLGHLAAGGRCALAV